MKKIFSILIAINLLSLLIAPIITTAWVEPKHPDTTSIGTGWRTAILDPLVTAIKTIWVVVVVIMFLYAAILFATSEGDSGKMTKAKNTFFYGVIGVAVGVLVYSSVAIIEIIKQIFNITP